MKISIQHLTKVFPSREKKGKPVVAVNDMSIEIPSGKLVGLLGPSGCGKSTTLFMLSGLESPTQGNIFFDEQDVTTLAPERRGIGLVFQNYALYPHMTVAQNIMFPLLNMRIPKEQAKEKALDAARLVQIEELMARKPSELSADNNNVWQSLVRSLRCPTFFCWTNLFPTSTRASDFKLVRKSSVFNAKRA